MSAERKKLLIIGSTQGVYGGIEAFMMAVAEAAQKWPELDVKVCFKLVKNVEANEHIVSMARKYCSSVHFVRRGSRQLMDLIRWADIVHAQNMPPDIVIPAFLKRKKILLTVHNKKFPQASLHRLMWGVTIRLADKRWFNSNFVWNTWEPGEKDKNSACIPTVCRFPDEYVPPQDRKGFLFVGRGSEAARLAAEAKARGLENTMFHDEIHPLEIPALYAQCAVGLVCLDLRHRTHNIPGKFLTYMQAGLPVLASVNPGNDLIALIEGEQVGAVSTAEDSHDLSDKARALLTRERSNAIRMAERCIALSNKLFSSEIAVRQIVDALQATRRR